VRTLGVHVPGIDVEKLLAMVFRWTAKVYPPTVAKIVVIAI